MRGLLAALVLLPGAALAGANDDCPGDGGNVPERIACLRTLLSEADARLATVWEKVLADHPSGGNREAHRAAIVASQEAWAAFRDAECEAVQYVGIAKYWDMNRLECLVDLTRARAERLAWTYGVEP